MKVSYSVLLASLFALPAHANLDAEIDRLISKIEHSSCTFYRNGKAHLPSEAAEHIANKWDYAKDDVDSLQTFISEVASKSWFTGKPYMVECDAQTITSEQWLLELSQTSESQ